MFVLSIVLVCLFYRVSLPGLCRASIQPRADARKTMGTKIAILFFKYKI